MMNKKYFMHLMAAMMVAMLSVGFASCSSDNDDNEVPETTTVNVKDLVGTWGLTHAEGWDAVLGQKETFSDDYDPENPKGGDDTKMVITNPSGNTFVIVQYEWDDFKKDWVEEFSGEAELDANKLTAYNMTFLSVSATQLVAEVSAGSLGYTKQTYKRMK